MPKQKDLKRLVRSRMQKTGESYTAARSHLLKKKGARPHAAVSEAEFARLAGMSDEAVRAKTGRTWKQWVRVLDAVDATAWPHRDIAKHLRGSHDVSAWWAQAITVAYERIRGLREVGQRRGGTYECNKSRTFPVSVTKLYKMFSTARARSRWLPGVDLAVRAATVDKTLRCSWSDGTPVDIAFVAKGEGKSQVVIQHRKLPRKADAERMKTLWSEHLSELGARLVASKARS